MEKGRRWYALASGASQASGASSRMLTVALGCSRLLSVALGCFRLLSVSTWCTTLCHRRAKRSFFGERTLSLCPGAYSPGPMGIRELCACACAGALAGSCGVQHCMGRRHLHVADLGLARAALRVGRALAKRGAGGEARSALAGGRGEDIAKRGGRHGKTHTVKVLIYVISINRIHGTAALRAGRPAGDAGEWQPNAMQRPTATANARRARAATAGVDWSPPRAGAGVAGTRATTHTRRHRHSTDAQWWPTVIGRRLGDVSWRRDQSQERPDSDIDAIRSFGKDYRPASIVVRSYAVPQY